MISVTGRRETGSSHTVHGRRHLAVWPPGRELSISDHRAGFFSKDRFVGHRIDSGHAAPRHPDTGVQSGREAAKPNAMGRDARCVNQGTRWKANTAYHVGSRVAGNARHAEMVTVLRQAVKGTALALGVVTALGASGSPA
jgi:hypothetical protein